METSQRTAPKAAVHSSIDRSGNPLQHITLQNGDITVELTNIGCSVMAIRTPDQRQVVKNIVAGFTDIEQYFVNKDYLGSTIGRCANRIAEGKFMLNGELYQLSINDYPNHLHGGKRGFSHRLWKLEEVLQDKHACRAVFSYHSPDGEEGYPGNLAATATYTLHRNNSLSVSYKAVTDKNTPVNLTSHCYFNLTGFEHRTIVDHFLWVNADYYTTKSAANTPTGKFTPVHQSVLDFREKKPIGPGMPGLPVDMGYDHNFVLKNASDHTTTVAAILCEETTGRLVKVYTDLPGIHIYTANYWDGTTAGEQGCPYEKHGGIALETQYFPDSVNHPHFPNTILSPGKEYSSNTIFEFGITNFPTEREESL